MFRRLIWRTLYRRTNMPNIRRWLLVVGLIICLLPWQPGWAQESKTLRVGWFLVDGFQEYHGALDPTGGKGYDTKGVYSGYNYAYLKAVAQYTGWRYQFVVVSMEDAFKWLEAGRLDLLCGIVKSGNREQRFLFPEIEMGSSGLSLVTKEENNKYAFGDFHSFNGLHIGVVEPSYQRTILEHITKAYNFKPVVSTYTSFGKAAQALAEGEVEALLTNTLSTEKGRRVLAMTPAEKFYMITSRQHPELIPEINNAILQIKYLQPDFDQTLANTYFFKNANVSLAFSAEEKAFLDKRRDEGTPVLVTFDPAWAPIEYKDPVTGEIRGIMAEVFARISEQTGLQFKFVTASTFAEAVASFGRHTELYTAINNDLGWTDALDVYVTQPVFDVPVMVVFSPTMNRYNEVALPQGYHLTKAVKERLLISQGNRRTKEVNEPEVQEYGTMDECVEAVRTGKAGRTYINAYELNYYMNTGKLTNLNVQSVAGFSEPTGIGISKQADPRLFTIMGKALRSIPPSLLSDIIIRNTNTKEDRGLKDVIYKHPMQSAAAGSFIILLIGSAGFFYYSNKHNERLRRELEQANNAKTDFLNRMSHDIRTPMNAIIGLTEIVRSENKDFHLEDYLGKINYSSKYLLTLINDILDLSKIESGGFTLNPEPYCLSEFTGIIKSTIAVQAQIRGLTFLTDFSPELPLAVKVDILRFNQIFINLLGNAIKYTPTGGTVKFSLRGQPLEGSRMRLTGIVQDNGIGMGADFLPHLFEPFNQEDAKHAGTGQGTGLGLSIVKKLLDLMGGTIKVASVKNKGSSFTVNLEVELVKDGQNIDAGLKGKERLNLILERQASLKSPPQTEPLQQAGGNPDKEIKTGGQNRQGEFKVLTGKRILVAEDDKINQEVVGRLLVHGGMSYELADNGRQCLEIFKASPEYHFDLILMDVRMPVLDGLEAARELRRLPRQDAGVPIVALTADAYADMQEKARLAGMNAYLAKPVYPKKLYQVLQQELQGRS